MSVGFREKSPIAAVGRPGPPRALDTPFTEHLIYEQLAPRTVREQQEKRSSAWSRQPLKIEQLRRCGQPQSRRLRAD